MYYCANCGSKMLDSDEFCSECGWKRGTEVKESKSQNYVGPVIIVLVLILLCGGGFFTFKTIFNNQKKVNRVENTSGQNNVVKETETSASEKKKKETKEKKTSNFSDTLKNARAVTDYGFNSTVEDFDVVRFGTYQNGIEWIVLEKNTTVDGNNYALLLSKYVIDSVQYNTKYDYTFWETSYARQWLNNTFYNTAFNDNEKSKIIEMTIENPRNFVYPNVEGGVNTPDKVFLLSFAECAIYFGNDIDGRNLKLATKATDYAISKGAYRHMSNGVDNGNTMYWLRSPGSTKMNACDISPLGYLNYAGNVVNLSQGIRPAIYVWY